MLKISELTQLFRNVIKSQPRSAIVTANYSKQVDKPSDDFVYTEDEDKFDVKELLVDEVDEEQRRAEIEAMRNKSRLRKHHKHFLEQKPLPSEDYQWDKTLHYCRKQYARYGEASGVDPRLCFRTVEERADKKEYLKVAYPLTMKQMLAENQRIEAEKKDKIQKREEKIAANLGKLGKWMDDLNARIAKKEADALAAKEKRERLMEEVRQHFGFKVDPRDPRLKEMIEKKEVEEKKAKKLEKKKQKEELLMQRLREQAASTSNEESKKLTKPAELEQKDEADDEEVAEIDTKKSKKPAKVEKKKKEDDSDSDSDSDKEDNNKKKSKK